nr:trypsin-like peptidase domain-containing protein [uncultured Flavobacterium sp.]
MENSKFIPKLNRTIIILLFSISFYVSKAQSLSSEESYRDYFKKNMTTLDPIEGIWSMNVTTTTYLTERNEKFEKKVDYKPNQRKIAIIKNNNRFEFHELNVITGQANIYFEPTATNIYLYHNNKVNVNANAFLANHGTTLEYERVEVKIYTENELKAAFAKSNGRFTYDGIESWKRVNEFKFMLVKVFPNTSDYYGGNKSGSNYTSSGTGFAISNSGYIITNYHVIKDANNIYVKGVNGNFYTKIKAILIASDINNDLAIIKLNNSQSINGTIPYIIQSKNSAVGSSVYALGYPLRATMGDEVKLTNGIISANSGFQGDVTKYQISVPIQPGNSGGPLINSNGYLTGVVNAKHSNTDNVSYAIKSAYILSLISSVTNNISVPKINLLNGKPLNQQVLLAKKYVYIIEVE